MFELFLFKIRINCRTTWSMLATNDIYIEYSSHCVKKATPMVHPKSPSPHYKRPFELLLPRRSGFISPLLAVPCIRRFLFPAYSCQTWRPEPWNKPFNYDSCGLSSLCQYLYRKSFNVRMRSFISVLICCRVLRQLNNAGIL